MGKIKMGVGLYSCKTSDHDRGVAYISDNGAEVGNIIKDLDMQIKTLADHIKKEKIPGFGVQGIFIGPEYLFSAGNGKTSKRGVPEYVKGRIIDEVKKLSIKYRNIIIIPGSICWYTSALGGGVANMSMGGTLSVSEASKPLPVMNAKKAWEDNNLKNLVGDLKDTGKAKTTAHEAKKSTGDHVSSKFQKNTLPVFHDGKLVSEYSKSSDYKESHVDNVFHVPEAHPGLIEINTHKGKLTLGLEVCLDHAYKVLNTWLSSSITNQQPHLHIISSASVETKYAVCKNNCWLLHASSDPNETCIWHRGKPSDYQKLAWAGLLKNVIEVTI